MASINDNEKFENCNIPEALREISKSLTQLSEESIESEDILLIRNKMNKLQEFQKDGEMYQKINSKLQNEIISPRKPVQEMQLESELESLSFVIKYQKVAMKQMQMNFELSKFNLELKIDQWRAKFEDSEKSHHTKVAGLRGLIKFLSNKKSSKGQEDIDLSEAVRQILVASSVFGTDDSEGYSSLVYDLVKRAVDTKINQMAKKHEDSINKINEAWETKIKSDLNNNQFRKRCEKLEKENILLREKFVEDSRRLSLEKDAHWQAKLNNIENSTKLELKTKYENEIANIKISLDSASKERSSAEAKASTLNRQINDLKKKFQGQKNEMVKEFENKLSVLEKELKDRRDAEMVQRQEIERLSEDFQSQLKREKNLEERHREEVANLHKFFEAKLIDEITKIQMALIGELRKLNSKETKINALYKHLFTQYEDRLKGIQEEYAKKLADEQAKTNQRHNSELHKVQLSFEVRFEKEKKQILEERDKETQKMKESFEKKLAKKIQELRSSSSEEQLQSRSEAHSREIENLQRDLGAKLRVEEGKRQCLEVAHLRQVKKVKEASFWLEERKWIVNKITNITPETIENPANLKLVINNLVEELLNARQRLSCEEINGSKERFSELERQLDYEH